ncbi:MAG: NAD-dependent epimerase/dehydratase family protein [Actinobacteria bacterium]|nr:MAG: NAD-dependent epimerase/dehydratase family protein [Actinomycetota bacterium]
MVTDQPRTSSGKPDAPTRVAIVGAGYVSAHHLRALKDLPFIRVVGICDRDQARARAMARRFAVADVYPTLDAMAAAKPDVIHVLTPPASHCALALAALDMGCHVFVEKPMAESPEECDRMIAKAREKGLMLSVNHSDLFDPVMVRAMDLVRAGACGEVAAVHFIRSSDYPHYAGGPLPASFRQGSYPFRDLGVHGLYLLDSFLGPVRDLYVRHYESGRDPLLTFDEWRVLAECERGTGYLYLSWNTRPMQSEVLIHGTRGMIRVDRLLQTCEIHRTLPGPKQIGLVINGWQNALRRSAQIPLNLLRFLTGSLKASPGIYQGVQAFHIALNQKTPVPVAPEAGRRVVAWIASASERADREKEARLTAELNRPLRAARILVTGGAGFLGSALVERLQQTGEPIRLLLRRPPRPSTAADPTDRGGHVSILYGSLGEPDIVHRAVEGVEIVYHLGAAMKGSKEEFEQGTIWGTRNVIEACLQHKVSRLVYVSSLSVLDHAGHADSVPVSETSPYEPFPNRRGAYSKTKLEAEHMVLEAMRERGLPAVIIRPGQIFGPGAEHVTPNGVIAIGGQWIVAGNGRRALPLVYRDDVVDALLRAAASDRAIGRIVNVVDPRQITQNEYLRRLKGVKVRHVPVPLLTLVAIGIEVLGAVLKRDVPLTRYRIRSLRPLAPFDLSQAREILGWTPAVGIEQGLQRTFG